VGVACKLVPMTDCCVYPSGILRMYDSFYYKEHLFIVTELLRVRVRTEAALCALSHAALCCATGEPVRVPKVQRRVWGGALLHLPPPAEHRNPGAALPGLYALPGPPPLRPQARKHPHSVLLTLPGQGMRPRRVLLSRTERSPWQVIDVGSSCFITDHLSSYVQSRSYRAPEVILGLPYDARIDVWSLGCILAELWSGHVLFQNDSLATLLARVSSILGPLPPRLMAGRHAHKFFTLRGCVRAARLALCLSRGGAQGAVRARRGGGACVRAAPKGWRAEAPAEGR